MSEIVQGSSNRGYAAPAACRTAGMSCSCVYENSLQVPSDRVVRRLLVSGLASDTQSSESETTSHPGRSLPCAEPGHDDWAVLAAPQKTPLPLPPVLDGP